MSTYVIVKCESIVLPSELAEYAEEVEKTPILLLTTDDPNELETFQNEDYDIYIACESGYLKLIHNHDKYYNRYAQ